MSDPGLPDAANRNSHLRQPGRRRSASVFWPVFIFGISGIFAIVVANLFLPNPTHSQSETLRIVLALSAAGVAISFPVKLRFGKWLQSGAAVVFFGVVYFFHP